MNAFYEQVLNAKCCNEINKKTLLKKYCIGKIAVLGAELLNESLCMSACMSLYPSVSFACFISLRKEIQCLFAEEADTFLAPFCIFYCLFVHILFCLSVVLVSV